MERTLKISAEAIIETNKGKRKGYGQQSRYYNPVVVATDTLDITNLFRANSSVSCIDIVKVWGDFETEEHKVVTTYYYSSLRQKWEPHGKLLSLYKNGKHIYRYIDFN